MYRYCFLRYPGGRGKAVTLSYDDGVRYDVPLARIIDKYGIKCTFNLNTGFMTEDRKANKLMPEEVKAELLDHGHEVAVHGKFHRAPGLCRPFEVAADVMDCRRELEEMFGMIIRGMAYPDSGIRNIQNGTEYPKIKEILEELGIVYSRTLGGDNNEFKLPTDWHAWMPTAHHSNPKALEWAKEFAQLDTEAGYGARRYPRLFYLWGHSYEFNNDNNWELLEELCQVLGNREDTWYATNMEIYDYVTAFRQLVFSADGSMVYNPSLVKVWFDADGTAYSIEPGQTLKLG